MKRLALAVALLIALTGCSTGSPAARLQSKMNEIASAANAQDSTALRNAVQDFLQEVQAQSVNGDITATKADRLRSAANQLLSDAGTLDKASPSPTPSPSPSPSPSPTPSPSPSPSPSPPPSPPPSPSPSPSPAQPSAPTVQVSLSPAALGGGAAASPSPSPAATAPTAGRGSSALPAPA